MLPLCFRGEAGRDRANEEARRVDHQERLVTLAGLVLAALEGAERARPNKVSLLMIGSFHVVEGWRVSGLELLRYDTT